MWSGAIADIDTVCWALCDGTPPTPDLRNRFIVSYGDKYNVGDTGGADTVDISHLHAAGTLVADNESAHTHGDGTYTAANDTHNHADTFTIDNDAHTHDVTGTSGSESAHWHGFSVTTTVPAAGSGHNVSAGAGLVLLSKGTFDAHTHGVNGATNATTAHSHSDGTYAAASDTHNHGISGSVSNDTHNHDVTGTSGAGSAHGHTISGNTATGGDTTHDNRPAFFALAFIMRTS